MWDMERNVNRKRVFFALYTIIRLGFYKIVRNSSGKLKIFIVMIRYRYEYSQIRFRREYHV